MLLIEHGLMEHGMGVVRRHQRLYMELRRILPPQEHGKRNSSQKLMFQIRDMER